MKDYFIKIIRDFFCFKRNILEEIISIEFKEINYKYCVLNCFNSNDLSFFIDKENEYFKNFFIREEQTEDLSFLKIDSICASKSKSSGYRFNTIYSFGKNVFIDRKMNWKYEDCIKHIENSKNTFNLFHFKWNNRYEWDNGDGSHHFAVANFIATNNKYEKIFNCHIKSYSINIDVANKLLKNFEMFVFNIHSYIIDEIFKEDIVDVVTLQDGHIIVLFDKEKAENSGYLKLLKLIDEKYVLHFNEYLYTRLKYLKIRELSINH